MLLLLMLLIMSLLPSSMGSGTSHNRNERRLEAKNPETSRTSEFNHVVRFQTQHKMGYVLSYRFRKRFPDVKTTFGSIKPKLIGKTVVVVRDLFDATVSGYLYHKSGNECWNDHWGNPNQIQTRVHKSRNHTKFESNHQRRLRNDDMSRKNWTDIVATVPVPANIYNYSEYDLCEALESTSETIGMGIYLELARKKYYNDLAILSDSPDEPAFYVCIGDMKNHPNETEQKIRDFYNGQVEHGYMALEESRRRLDTQATKPENGHATNTDPILRKRLYDIAREVDCKYFGCETKIWNDKVLCPSSIDKNEDKNTKSEVTATPEKDETSLNAGFLGLGLGGGVTETTGKKAEEDTSSTSAKNAKNKNVTERVDMMKADIEFLAKLSRLFIILFSLFFLCRRRWRRPVFRSQFGG